MVRVMSAMRDFAEATQHLATALGLDGDDEVIAAAEDRANRAFDQLLAERT